MKTIDFIVMPYGEKFKLEANWAEASSQIFVDDSPTGWQVGSPGIAHGICNFVHNFFEPEDLTEGVKLVEVFELDEDEMEVLESIEDWVMDSDYSMSDYKSIYDFLIGFESYYFKEDIGDEIMDVKELMEDGDEKEIESAIYNLNNLFYEEMISEKEISRLEPYAECDPVEIDEDEDKEDDW